MPTGQLFEFFKLNLIFSFTFVCRSGPANLLDAMSRSIEEWTLFLDMDFFLVSRI